jgi:hypothetical protein
VKFEDLAQAVSARSGVDLQSTQKVLDAAFGALNEDLARKERIEFQGLGTFIQKQGRKTGTKGKTLFRSWSAARAGGEMGKEEKSKKKARKKVRKGAKHESPP